jgi:hypothetical protein
MVQMVTAHRCSFQFLRPLVVLLAAATAAVASPAAAQSPGRAPAGAKEALETRRTELEAQIQQADATISDAATRRDQNQVSLDEARAELPRNEAELERIIDAQVAPAKARVELAVASYVGGDPQQRQWLDTIASGEFDTSALRRAELFDAAEEYARERLVELDRQQRALEIRSVELQTRALESEAALNTAVNDLVAAEAVKAGAVAELDQIERELRRYGSNPGGLPLTGLPGQLNRPALAVKIDNHPAARPQSGLNEADIVYEELVEGGITRFIAVYHSTDPAVIGPIRSGRTSDLDILANLNRALFGASGGNDYVLRALGQANLASVIEARNPGAYWRDSSRSAPHNLYASASGLFGANPGNAGEPPRLFTYREPGQPPAAGQPVSSVTVAVGNDRVSYRWDGSLWQRSLGGSVQTDANGKPLGAPNLVIQFVGYGISPADAASPEVRISGSGDVWVLTGGQLITGTWRRDSPFDITFLVDAAGNEIPLSPGRTWVLLPEPGGARVG